MAYALYARGLATLARATGDERYLDAADAVLERLLTLRARESEAAWGLGFAYRGLPATHPFTITTAMSAWAFIERNRTSPDDRWLSWLDRTCRWLVGGVPWRDGAPTYGPSQSMVAVNVVGTVAGALYAAHDLLGDRTLRDRAADALLHVRDTQSEVGYWTYVTPDEPLPETAETAPWRVIDSLHTAYVLEGAIAADQAGAGRDPRFLGLRSLISRGLGWHLDKLVDRGLVYEKAVLADPDDPGTRLLLRRRAYRKTYLSRGRWVVPYPREGRLWNYGATVGVGAKAYRAGVGTLGPVDAIVGQLLSAQLASASGRFSYLPTDRAAFPRHEGHLFEGLAAAALAAAPQPVTVTG